MNPHNPVMFSRREFCASAIAYLALGTACRGRISQTVNHGRLTARPQPELKTAAGGRVMLGLDKERDAILQLPKNASNASVPLLVLLHGATQNAEDMFWYLGSVPEETGVAVLAPNSRGTTWDAIGGDFEEDVEFLDRALKRTFETAAIDPARLAVGGFSDGASYALALGLINGDLFRGVVAFSPGFVVSNIPEGNPPRFFVSHGTEDHILPINRCGRRIAKDLNGRGYDVTFREFQGDHEIPPEIVREGLTWVATLSR